MTYTSVSFLIFVLASLLVYYCFPKKLQWTVLLAASYFFYLFNGYKYAAFILVTTITTYVAALIIEKISGNSNALLAQNKEAWSSDERKAEKKRAKKRQKAVLTALLLLNFGILFVLKYMTFLTGSLNDVLASVNVAFAFPQFKLVLPLGISFYTFQTMGYAIDVYRGKAQAQHNIAKLALFVSYFPQIVQGPISFYKDLAHQFFEPHAINYDNLKSGFQLILWGLFKKLVIADRAVSIVTMVSDDYTMYNGAQILLAILVYSFQLYADFSGGIDITRGVSQMFGIELAQNFRQPYFSKSISEYWRRWHITLGAWLKEYLFFPIAMSKKSLSLGKMLKKHCGKFIGKVLPTCIASIITFLIIGVWHGANWKFVAFGLWNGLIITISTLLEPLFDKIKSKTGIRTECFSFDLFRMARTYLIVLIGLVFDIAPSFTGALKMMKLSVTDLSPSYFIGKNLKENFLCFNLSFEDYAVIAAGLLVMLVVGILREKNESGLRVTISKQNIWFEWALMLACFTAILIFGSYGPGYAAADFVYMQF